MANNLVIAVIIFVGMLEEMNDSYVINSDCDCR